MWGCPREIALPAEILEKFEWMDHSPSRDMLFIYLKAASVLTEIKLYHFGNQPWIIDMADRTMGFFIASLKLKALEKAVCCGGILLR